MHFHHRTMPTVAVKGREFISLITMSLVVIPCFLGYTESNDPILKYICSEEIGDEFWNDLIQCNVVLNQKFLLALTACIPSSTMDEAQSTRAYICACPEKWIKMMDCLNMHLIEQQDHRNPYLELSPGGLYRRCVSILIEEAERSVLTGEPFLDESGSDIGNGTYT